MSMNFNVKIKWVGGRKDGMTHLYGVGRKETKQEAVQAAKAMAKRDAPDCKSVTVESVQAS